MKKLTYIFFTLIFVSQFTACGGGGAGSSPPINVINGPQLSEDQRIFESVFLLKNGGASEITFPQGDPYFTPQQAIDYFGYSQESINASPLSAGAQTLQRARYSGFDTLEEKSNKYRAVLLGGKITFFNYDFGSANIQVVYEGSHVQMNFMAVDNVSIAISINLENFILHPLSGAIATTPMVEKISRLSTMQDYLAARNIALTYLPGSAALSFATRLTKDDYAVRNCSGAPPAGVQGVSACVVSSDLSAALTKGISYEGTTFILSSGTNSVVDGKNVWVSNQPKPSSQYDTKPLEQIYTFFFEQNGKIYGGDLTRSGQILSGDFIDRRGDTHYANYTMNFNKAARDSIRKAVTGA